jgi:hypothetical protein
MGERHEAAATEPGAQRVETMEEPGSIDTTAEAVEPTDADDVVKAIAESSRGVVGGGNRSREGTDRPEPGIEAAIRRSQQKMKVV